MITKPAYRPGGHAGFASIPAARPLFETNTFWELKAERTSARQNSAGNWEVTLEIDAQKQVVDEIGKNTLLPLNDWVEIEVFAPVRSGKQAITVTVPRKPGRAGIDPHHLLIDVKMDDNTREVKTE